MGQNRLDYEKLCADALRGVVRRALLQVADKGLPPGNHFLITFKTDHPGVTMPDYLRERYPDTISVMLQYEFWNLEVEDDHFSVSLSFSEVREHLTIPFLAVTAFVDPFAKFQLKFEAQMESDAATLHKRDKQPAHLKPAESGKAEAKDDAKDKSKSGEVVTLDAFRKK
jgi:Uncharacterized protein conserved in bacteria